MTDPQSTPPTAVPVAIDPAKAKPAELADFWIGKARQVFTGALVNTPVAPAAFEAAVRAELHRSDGLVQCLRQNPMSLIEQLEVCASSGLIPGAAYGLYYLIPRKIRDVMTCTGILGYKGMAELAYRHPKVHKFEAFVVHKGEPFEFDPAAGKLKHQWIGDIERTEETAVAAYSRVIVTAPDGQHVDPEPLLWAMSRDEILKLRARSAAFRAGKKDSPWFTDPLRMWRKTAMRQHFNGGSIPRSMVLVQLLAREDEEDRWTEPPPAPAAKGSDALRDALNLPPKPESEPGQADDGGVE